MSIKKLSQSLADGDKLEGKALRFDGTPGLEYKTIENFGRIKKCTKFYVETDQNKLVMCKGFDKYSVLD